MALPAETPGIQGNVNLELIGVDSLWSEDPTARIAYSSNPGFGLNADISPPAAAKHLLASPEIVDALEMVDRLSRPRHQGEHSNLTKPELLPSAELARRGLKRLKGELRDGSSPGLRIAVSDTKKRLSSNSSSLIAYQQNAAITAEDSPKTESQENPQARYQAELAAAIAEYHDSDMPTFDDSVLTTLAREIILEPNEHGFDLKDKPRFGRKLARIIDGYSDRPSTFLRDIQGLTSMAKLTAGDGDKEAIMRKPAHVITRAILTTIIEDTSFRTYMANDFTSARIAEWLQFGKDLPPTIETFDRFIGPGGIEIDIDHSPEDLAALALISGNMVLTRSLSRIADSQPRNLVDSLYSFADTGLGTSNRLVEGATLSSIKLAMAENERIGTIVGLSVGANGHPLIQQKAIDLQVSLSSLGVPRYLIYPGETYETDGYVAIQNPGQMTRQAIRELYSTVLTPKDTPYTHTSEYMKKVSGWYRQWLTNFLQFAASPEGQATTIFGRLCSPEKIQATLTKYKEDINQ